MMDNHSMSVASRTRSRRDAALLKEHKKRKKRQAEAEAEENMRTAESSTRGRDNALEVHVSDDDVICLDSDDSDDAVSTESSDDPVTSSSGEDNDDSEDLDYGEEEEEEDDDDERDEAFKTARDSHAEGVMGEEVHELVSEQNGAKTPAPVGRKRKSSKGIGSSGKASKKIDLLKVLADSILDKQHYSAPTFNEETNHNRLPFKFTFGGVEQQPISTEKKPDQLDDLWAEMQFCLASSDTASTFTDPPASVVEHEDANNSQVQRDTATLCRQGNHQLILDEEIGMKCKFCNFLQLEIKYIVPPFMTHPCGKFERRYCPMMESSIFDCLRYQDFDCDFLGRDSSEDIEGTVWEIIPKVKSQLYPHQRDGFEFIWNNIAGGIYLDKSKNKANGVGGCVISHAPGTGKSLLIIVFLYTYLKEYPNCRPVIVAPRSMLLTWEAEFRKWKVDIPFHNLNTVVFSGNEKTKGIGLYEKYKQNVPDRHLAQRLVKLLSWKSDGGVLGISYGLFKQLVGRAMEGKRKCANIDEHVSRILLELPGLFVLDEGHIARNDETLMWKALSMIKTERRIILSGTPFQNNFDELFHTLSLVRPKFVEGIQKERVDRRRWKRNEEHSKWVSLTGSVGKVVDRFEADLKQLRYLIRPFVHVHKGTILQTTLPGLRHSVVVLRPSDLQKKILECIKETRNALCLDYYLSLISVHPSLLQQLSGLKEIMEGIDSIVSKDELERIRLNPDKGVKTKFVKQLLKLSEALNEKVIVFSQFLEPLNLIMDQLKDCFKWKEGEEILYMDGHCDIKQRQSSINVFNDPTSNARVLLASTKACSEGINLVGGSRVVLLDVTWNPSVERQAISRAYRLGQKKVVYTYHLISSGTMEGLKCYRQAGKDRISNIVFSSSDKGDDHKKKVCDVFEDKILEEMCQQEKLKSLFEKIINQPKDSDLIATFGDL